MIDIQCHILPGLDDGPQDISETIAMLKKAKAEGITTIIATPHHRNGNFENPKETIEQKISEVNAVIKNREMPLTLLPGQVCRITGGFMQDYENGEILTAGNSNFVFIELPPYDVPKYTSQLLYDIQLKGLVPIIVHPERNRALEKEPDRLYQLVKQGALTQLTAASIVGELGKKIKYFSHEIIEANLAHFIASDAHNINDRSFFMKEAYELVHQLYGDSMESYFKENANLLVENQYIVVEQSSRIQRRKKVLGLF